MCPTKVKAAIAEGGSRCLEGPVLPTGSLSRADDFCRNLLQYHLRPDEGAFTDFFLAPPGLVEGMR